MAPTLLPFGAMPRSLEAVSGLESNSRVFTVQVQGLLQLQVRVCRLREQAGGLLAWEGLTALCK